MIKREWYLNKLRQLKGKNLIKVVTGIRRCGKSTLLESFRQDLIDSGVPVQNIISLNFEDRDAFRFSNWTELFDDLISKLNPDASSLNYVFLDEVQQIAEFEKLIDALYVRKNVDLYVTGSNAFLLSSELATLLSGRYIAIHLLPFSFSEYVLSFPQEANTDRLFRRYLNSSCFPEAVNLYRTSAQLVNDYLKSVYETVVVKDIVKRHKLRKPDTLQRIMEFLFDSVGSLVSPTNIAERLNENSDKKISHNTIIKVLNYLTESYLLYAAQRYDIKGKELLSSNKKYYVVDLGLKNILQTNKYDSDLGHKLENVVYFELVRRGGNVYVGKSGDGEVDFVVQKPNDECEYYQVAYTVSDESTLKRELSSLRKLRNSYPKFILSMDFDNANINGIRKMNVIDWLLDNK